MSRIHFEMQAFMQYQEELVIRRDAKFQAEMRLLFIFIVVGSVFAFVIAVVFVYFVYQQSQHRIKNLVFLKTQELLASQERSNQQLQKMIAVAEKANLAKSEFLSSMSHELRTPLSAILGFAQLIDSGTPEPSAAQKRSLDQILQSGWYLLDLINEILDLALIESGRLSVSCEPMALNDVLQECRMMVEPKALERDIILSFPPAYVSYTVHADRTRLKQVIINLLTNAIKYNVIGGKVIVDCKECAPGYIHISIKDTGEGLSPEQTAQLFQPFNRLGQEIKATEGTGIGLVLSKRLIELMEGTIGADSMVGEGSVFWVELKSTEAALPVFAPNDTVKKIVTPVDANMKKRTLLYVEDNPANLMLIEDLVARRLDLRLISARDGIQGIEMARTEQPDIILMDINLPGITGVKALQILQDDPLTMHIPVIAVSANAMPRDIEKGLKAGFFRYLTKPIMVNSFMDTIDLALKVAETRATNSPVEKAW
ncbi:MAG: response regulator [Gammaproteobacteria bacterium]|nr:response regulator [Gammaproteobacteria bacterium]